MRERVLVIREDAELSQLGELAVRLDPAVMSRLGVRVGGVVRISTAAGRKVLARVASPLREDEGRECLRVGRWQRQALKARLYEAVEVEPVESLPQLQKVVLHPALHISGFEFMSATLAETLRGEPLTAGMVLYLPVRPGGAGMVFTVLATEPTTGIFGEATECHVEWGEDGHTHPPGQGHGETGGVTLEDVGGLDQVVELVRQLVQLPLQFPEVYRIMGITLPRGIILYGPPGVGKTHLARALSNEINARFFMINGPEVVGTMYGETEANLRRIFGQAIAQAPSVVVIDELDAIAPKREWVGSQSDARVVATLLSLMDGLQKVDGVVVIGTTNRLEAIDASLRRPGRFDREVYIGPPDARGRLEILRIYTREMPLDEDAARALSEIAERTHGFVGADLVELCRESGLEALRRSVGKGDVLEARRGAAHVSVTREDFEAALRRIRPSALRESWVVRPRATWEEVAGATSVKARLESLVVAPLRACGERREVVAGIRGGVVLYGPPGTGKTLLAQAAAAAAGVNLVWLSGPEVFSRWLGETEEAVRHLFRVARQVAPCIVFIDQLDAIAPRRLPGSEGRTAQRVVNQLLVELDALGETADRGMVVLAATNRLDMVDPAVLRPGRLGTIVPVPLPNEEERAEILRLFLRRVPVEPDEAEEQWIRNLATRTEGLSGAELRALVEEARLQALRRDGARGRVGWEDLCNGLAAVLESKRAVESLRRQEVS